MDVRYEIYDYSAEEINRQVVELYWKVFNVNKGKSLGTFFLPNPAGKPIGIIATNDRGRIVGHFATMSIPVMIQGETASGRISMGFMVDPECRGMKIASNLSNNLFEALQKEGKTDFVIGFPNDNSFHMHITRMGYKHIRDFQMVTVPSRKKTVKKSCFRQIDNIKGNKQTIERNAIVHDEKFLNWRFHEKKYLKFQSKDGNFFVCNKYRECIQILYWSEQVVPEQCLEFADYIYNSFGVEEVRTWNFLDWLDAFPMQERKFHFCIHNLKEGLEGLLLEPWIFYPGDCELF